MVQEIVNLNPQTAILTGTVIGLLLSLLILGNLIETYFSIQYSSLNIPEWIKGNKKLSGFGMMYAGLKSPSIVPEGFDTILAVGFGTFGILLYFFLLMINKEKLPLISNLSFLATYSIIFYSLMRSVFIVFDRYALINIVILFFVILFPPYLLSKQIFSNQLQSLIMYWIPIITLYILPLLPKLFQKNKKEVLIN